MLGSIGYTIYAVLVVVAFFGLSVFVHEFGHFIAARLCGLVVDVFSIGFGPALWKRKIGALTLRLGWIPLGGYVVLPQLDPAGMDAVQENGDAPPRTLPRIPAWKKIIVSISGAAGNILFAFLLAWIVYGMERHPRSGFDGAMVGDVRADTPAHAAGMRAGDLIVAVDGRKVKNWSDVLQLCSLRESVALRLRGQDGVERDVTVATREDERLSGLRTLEGVEAGSIAMVGLVRPGSAAEKAGVRAGDVILAFNGEVVSDRGRLIERVQERDGLETAMTVKREGKVVALTVTPVLDPESPLITTESARTVAEETTVVTNADPRSVTVVTTAIRTVTTVTTNSTLRMVRMGVEFASLNGTPFEQVKQDFNRIFWTLKALVTPAQAGNAAKGIGGPISIFSTLFLCAENLLLLLGLVRFINVNLAILNLLPIPVLDGGHVIFALYEWIARRPPSEKLVRYLINFFTILLISLIVLLSFRDVKLVRKIFGARNAPAAEEAAP